MRSSDRMCLGRLQPFSSGQLSSPNETFQETVSDYYHCIHAKNVSAVTVQTSTAVYWPLGESIVA